MAGFNGVELLDGLPMKLATMDACRYEIGQKAAEIIAARLSETATAEGQIIELEPNFNTWRNNTQQGKLEYQKFISEIKLISTKLEGEKFLL